MVHRSTTNILLLIILQLSNGFSYIWMDERPETQVYDDSENKLDEQKFVNKRISVTPEILKRTFHSLLVNQGTFPIYKTVDNQKHCNCVMNFRPIDLGRDYFPRYLQTGICEPNSCEKYYQCVEKKYNVKVLRKKDLKDNDEVLTAATLPKGLRDFWTSATIPVGVACECVVDVQTPYGESL